MANGLRFRSGTGMSKLTTPCIHTVFGARAGCGHMPKTPTYLTRLKSCLNCALTVQECRQWAISQEVLVNKKTVKILKHL